MEGVFGIKCIKRNISKFNYKPAKALKPLALSRREKRKMKKRNLAIFRIGVLLPLFLKKGHFRKHRVD
jgi:hypothetical protein